MEYSVMPVSSGPYFHARAGVLSLGRTRELAAVAKSIQFEASNAKDFNGGMAHFLCSVWGLFWDGVA
jgi:hypothetical protein